LVPPLNFPGYQVDCVADPSVNYQDAARTTLAISDGDLIKSLSDASGHGNHLQSTNVNAKGTLKLAQINGLAAMLLNGTTDYLDLTFPTPLVQPIYVYASVRYLANAGIADSLYDQVGANDSRIVSGHGPTGNAPDAEKYDSYAGGAVLATSGDDPQLGNYAVYDQCFNGASSDLVLNGSTLASGNAGSNQMTSLRLGASYNLGFYTTAFLRRLVVYAGFVQTAAQRQQIRRFLGGEMGVNF
jgi:hypothetical protein